MYCQKAFVSVREHTVFTSGQLSPEKSPNSLFFPSRSNFHFEFQVPSDASVLLCSCGISVTAARYALIICSLSVCWEPISSSKGRTRATRSVLL